MSGVTEAKLKHEKLEAETGGAAQKATAAHQESQRQLASLHWPASRPGTVTYSSYRPLHRCGYLVITP